MGRDKAEAAKYAKPSYTTDGQADGYLKPITNRPVTEASVCWITDSPMGTEGEVVGEFLNSIALAGGAVLWGFNRSGGVTLTVMLAGTKQSYSFTSNVELFESISELTEMVLAYVHDKLPARYKAAETLGRL